MPSQKTKFVTAYFVLFVLLFPWNGYAEVPDRVFFSFSFNLKPIKFIASRIARITTSPFQLVAIVKEKIDATPEQIAGLFTAPSEVKELKERIVELEKLNEVGPPNIEKLTIGTNQFGEVRPQQIEPQRIIVREKEIIREVVLSQPPATSNQQPAEQGAVSRKLEALKAELTDSFTKRINTLVGGFGFNTNRFDDLFVQKSLELAGKLNQPATVASSPVTFSSSVSAQALDATTLSLSSTLTVSGTATSTISGPLKIAGGLTAGSGNVQIIDSTGKIPALSSTYFASLPSLFSSIGNASSTVQFSASGINDVLSFEATGGLLTISFDSTNKKIAFSASAPTLLSVLNQGADASTFSGTTKLGGALQVPTITTASGALTLNPTGDLQFYSSSNKVDSSGNLTLAGIFTINANATSTIENNLWVKGSLKVGSSSLALTDSGISSTGALTIASGGTNQNIALTPSGSGKIEIGGTLNATTFQKGGVAFNGMPTGSISYFTGACPSGWTEYTSARGRVVVGLPASGTAEGTVGTALTDVQNPTHTHTYTDVVNHTHSVSITDPGHSHTVPVRNNSVGGAGNSAMRTNDVDGTPTVDISSTNTTGITASTANPAGGVATGTTAGTSATMPYIQLRACQAPTGADYAENYPTKDKTLGAGEIVALDPKNPKFIKRLEDPTKETVIGAISNSPGYLIGDIWQKEGKDGIYYRPVALAGKIPVMVSLENGPILIGDQITVSQTRKGVGTKALSSGPVIGFAMQAYDPTARNESGLFVDTEQVVMIEVFIRLGFWYHLDADSSPVSDQAPIKNTFWKSFAVDPSTFSFKPLFGLDLSGKEITNVKSISSSSKTWSISEKGMISAKEIISQGRIRIGEEASPSGIELYDVKTGQLHCFSPVNGVLKSFIGECTKENFETMYLKATSTSSLTISASQNIITTSNEPLIDKNGNELALTQEGDIVVRKLVVLDLEIAQGGTFTIGKNARVKAFAGDNQITGKAAIPQGLTYSIVENSAVHPASKIFLTLLSTPPQGINYAVTKKGESQFTIQLSEGAPYTLEFDYWILDTYDTGQSSSNTPPQNASSTLPQ